MSEELQDINLDIETEVDQALIDKTEGILGNLAETPEAEERGQAEPVTPQTPTQPIVEEASTCVP